MKDLERMSQEELERAHRDARVTGDHDLASRAEDELDRREWAQAAKDWAEGDQ